MTEWISVKDRMPEEWAHVLVSNGIFVNEGYLDEQGNWKHGGVDFYFFSNITHWTPLPDPPEGPNS